MSTLIERGLRFVLMLLTSLFRLRYLLYHLVFGPLGMMGGEVILPVLPLKGRLACPSRREEVTKMADDQRFHTTQFKRVNYIFHGYPITVVSLLSCPPNLLEELRRYMRIKRHVRPQSPSPLPSYNYTLLSIFVLQGE